MENMILNIIAAFVLGMTVAFLIETHQLKKKIKQILED
jgi:fluoride ion exporter CrcB/FEX|tara:strand:+ start:620 stop:733 length:114 start_codon:yes stop_codon:yes gene_type:complete